MGTRDAAILEGVDGEQSMPKDSRLPPPGPPLLDKTERFFDMGAYVSESTVFPFVLIESFWRYSNPKSLVEGGAVKGNDAAFASRPTRNIDGDIQ